MLARNLAVRVWWSSRVASWNPLAAQQDAVAGSRHLSHCLNLMRISQAGSRKSTWGAYYFPQRQLDSKPAVAVDAKVATSSSFHGSSCGSFQSRYAWFMWEVSSGLLLRAGLESRGLSFHDCMLAYQKSSGLTTSRTELSARAAAEAVAGKLILAVGAPITGR